jgi:bile acid:Na+ symporter, BASS family
MTSTNRGVDRPLAGAAGVALAGAAAAWASGHGAVAGWGVVAALLLLALSCRSSAVLGGFTFTLSIFAGVAAALFYPGLFLTWGGYQLSNLIVPLIQVIMFGMGTTLSVADFARVLTWPRAILIGTSLQFAVMPVAGYALTRVFGFTGEVGAGVVLVGAAPGGVASNVITYLAGGNVPLSVTLTAVSTLLSPLATPMAMKALAGQYVPIDVVAMMWSIVKMIIVPIVAGLAVNRVLVGRIGWLHRALPVVSMTAICVIITIITAHSRDKLLEVALALVAVVVIHNAVGYTLGYSAARWLGMEERDARTVAIEVGMQNAGMASGLAIGVLRSSDAGIAAALFGPWMNISGSVLASWWRERSPGAPQSVSGKGGVR